ncbi:metallo-beta-lactamase superfamily protein [Sarocladium implicatum]|nr:metallo-beta-lactamase superfamily protein [Sarocladium implicatum]
MFLISSNGVVVVDAPPTNGRGLLWAIANTTDVPITHMVYSHSHADHFGAAYLIAPKGSEVQIVAHQLTYSILKMDVEPTRPLPHVIFDKEYTLRLGKQVLELSYKGLNHHPGNIFIYAPRQKILMLVDVVYPGWAPFSNLGQTKFVPGYIKAFDQALGHDFDRFVAGHVTRWGTRKDVEDGKRYVLELKENCARAIELSALPANATNPLNANAIIGPVQQANPDNLWAAFKVYVDTLTEYCAEKTNEKWIGVLAAVDTFGFENAYTMVESLRIDFGVLGPFGVLN